MRITKDDYTTSDLGLAAALTAAGYKLVAIDKSNPRRAVFIFEENPQLRIDAERYWQSQLVVSALSYFDALKNVKTRLYA